MVASNSFAKRGSYHLRCWGTHDLRSRAASCSATPLRFGGIAGAQQRHRCTSTKAEPAMIMIAEWRPAREANMSDIQPAQSLRACNQKGARIVACSRSRVGDGCASPVRSTTGGCALGQRTKLMIVGALWTGAAERLPCLLGWFASVPPRSYALVAVTPTRKLRTSPPPPCATAQLVTS
jgi:hypothetical protein